MSPVVLSPSDLGPARRKARLVLGGRVVFATPERCDLADAWTRVCVIGRKPLALEPGDLVRVNGRWQGQRLVDAELVARLPLPESRADGEFARQSWQGVGARLRARARACDETRRYFAGQRFLEVDTPLFGASPGFDAQVEGVRAEGGWLVTSPEQSMKRLLVGGLPRIFQLSHAFRGDERGPWHALEFLMLEWYRAFAEVEAVIDDTEQLVRRVARALRGKSELCAPDGRILSAKPPFPRLSVAEAFGRYAEVDDICRLAAEDPARYFELMVERVEPALARQPHPVWLWRYPTSQAALARPAPDDPEVAERCELYVGGIELANGFGELTDPSEHRRRQRAVAAERRTQGQRAQPVDPRFMAAIVEGLPWAAGMALGVDRLVALATGVQDIALVQPLSYG